MHYVLTIAGSDPTGGAGLQADLAVFRALGIHGLSVPVALTAQNTQGVRSTLGVDAGFVRLQIKCLLEDIKPGALKTGMLHNAGAVQAACEAVDKFSLVNLVVDPVCVSSSGYRLLDEAGIELMKSALFSRATVVTPNIPEAELITGMSISTIDDMTLAGGIMLDMGAGAVVVKGGHLAGSPVDIYIDREGIRRIEGERIEGRYHGTGCVYSAALAGYLAIGQTPYEAALKAKEFITSAIKRAFRPGGGSSIMGLF